MNSWQKRGCLGGWVQQTVRRKVPKSDYDVALSAYSPEIVAYCDERPYPHTCGITVERLVRRREYRQKQRHRWNGFEHEYQSYRGYVTFDISSEKIVYPCSELEKMSREWEAFVGMDSKDLGVFVMEGKL